VRRTYGHSRGARPWSLSPLAGRPVLEPWPFLLAYVRQAHIRRVTIIADADAPGQAGALKLAEALTLPCRIVDAAGEGSAGVRCPGRHAARFRCDCQPNTMEDVWRVTGSRSRKATPEKPEIRRIAVLCKCSQAEAFLAWFRLWAYFDEQTDDGFVRFLSHAMQTKSGNFADSVRRLAEVGWLAFDKYGLSIFNWERHNGRSAKRKMHGKRRKSQSPTRFGGMTGTVVSAKYPHAMRKNSALRCGKNADQRREEK